MDRQLLERMIGAGVLIVALIVIVPAILDGPERRDKEDRRQLAAPEAEEWRTVTITPDRGNDSPPVPTAAATADSALARPDSRPVADAEKTPAVTPPPEVQPKPVPEAQPETASKPAPEPQAKPKAESRPVPKPDPEPVSESRSAGWAVQLGSFASRENAERLATQVRARNFPAYLEPLERDGKTLYRVRIGPEPTREKAESLASRLRAAGFKGQVTRQEAKS